MSDRRPLEVYTNSYKITSLPTQPYFHFDVEIQPVCLTKNRAYEIIGRLQTDYANVFNPRPIFDGRKNMFCKRDIQGGQYNVAMGRDKQKVTHTVMIKRVSVINPQDVSKLMRRRQNGDNFELNAMSLNLLQLIVRQAPNLRHRFPADARSFYVQTGSRDLRVGLSAWRGFFQSVRPTMDRLLINIDVSHAAIYTPGYLIDTMMQWLGLKDVRELQTLQPPKFAQLRTFLKGVLVEVTTSPRMRPKPISDLVREAGMLEFDRDGERLTVRQHFETKYNVQVKHPRIVGVKLGKSAVIPAEFCKVIPGQVYRKKIPVEAQRGFLEFATQKPDVRFRAIEGAVQQGLFNYADSDYMQDAGMRVDNRPVTIKGQTLQPPPIQYGNGTLNITPKSGSWNVVGRSFLRPAQVKNWGVVIFDNRANTRQVQAFVAALVKNLHKLGMNVPMAEPPIEVGNAANPEASLEALGERLFREHKQRLGNPQLILVFLPANAADIRRAVKFWGDIRRNIATQCVRGGKWERISDQYCNNVALKINARLGGTNSTIVHGAVNALLAESMVVGADVGHPAPGSNHRPSITGMVATVDPNVSVMTSAAKVQEPRVEIIADLKDMMMEALVDWRGWRAQNLRGYNNMPPRNIIFYRDGVSEGEYAQVTKHEIEQIKEAFREAKIPEQLWPRLLFIVVGKRHHVRFFPKDGRDADRSGNCPAGLLVDEEITNPNYEDFYLQSHAGLLGTSRPSHYVILLNEVGMSKANIETLTFHLCHTYASATRSVSIPAPVYYADKICSRLEFHCADGAALSDTASNVTAANAQFDLAHWKQHVFQEVTDLRRHCYFL